MKSQLIFCSIFWITPFLLISQYNPKALDKAEQTIVAFKEKNSKFETFFSDAYGFAIFPSVGKGAIVVGAARGAGVTYELGNPIGKAILTQITIGFQWGGQAYSQVIFFESEEDLLRFKENKIEFAAQASAVAIVEGAAANLAYRDGVAVYSITKAGFMYEAAIGGQKLKFKPFKDQGQTVSLN